ncbi:estradiol 17-beta-dehydrogenase 2 isoform X2 [Camarhynchus parvulus]|uniref:estradiol 17-beta-dehydrogenase 2 isoform X2 n=1 Tax=Geospiza parvula TaxID=87175 RepID=UPI001237F65D|nr:estradiol 17-beta-dehydrogenase 2 isoform X2 [Camarhynchus parvulus]
MDAAASSPLGWLCARVTRLFGVTMAQRSPLDKAKVLLCSLLPALLCVATLGAGQGLGVFVAMCLLCSVCLGDRDLLPVGDRAVLITGSDTGIGHALAKHLDSLGFVVFAGVLNKDGPGAAELRRSCSQRLSVLQLDITNTTQVKEAYLTVSEKVQNAGLWGVVNNAGILGFPADGELLPMSTYRHCMEVNFFGAVEVSKTFLPLLRKSQGRLVNMSSMAGIEGTAEQWDRQEKELMENLPADTRQAYGEEYLLGLRNYLLHLPSHCAPDLSPVLGSVLHALLARRPQGLYTPGKGAYVPLCIFCCFPLWFYDFFISKVLSAGSVPRQLRASGNEGKNL